MKNVGYERILSDFRVYNNIMGSLYLHIKGMYAARDICIVPFLPLNVDTQK